MKENAHQMENILEPNDKNKPLRPGTKTVWGEVIGHRETKKEGRIYILLNRDGSTDELCAQLVEDNNL